MDPEGVELTKPHSLIRSALSQLAAAAAAAVYFCPSKDAKVAWWDAHQHTHSCAHTTAHTHTHRYQQQQGKQK